LQEVFILPRRSCANFLVSIRPPCDTRDDLVFVLCVRERYFPLPGVFARPSLIDISASFEVKARTQVFSVSPKRLVLREIPVFFYPPVVFSTFFYDVSTPKIASGSLLIYAPPTQMRKRPHYNGPGTPASPYEMCSLRYNYTQSLSIR